MTLLEGNVNGFHVGFAHWRWPPKSCRSGRRVACQGGPGETVDGDDMESRESAVSSFKLRAGRAASKKIKRSR
jgi:hypothetical protein